MPPNGTRANERRQEVRLETDAALPAMADEDWRLIEGIVETLRQRYPGLHIEYGPW
jgi:hypothetical protein